MKSIKLNSGHLMPSIGYGCYKVTGPSATSIIRTALKTGYRHFDCASFYNNESEVCSALSSTSTPRSEIFYTTKAWTSEQGSELEGALAKSLEKCGGLRFIDLYLLHWPSSSLSIRLESWRILSNAAKKGVVKSIGVSNYTIPQIEEILALNTGVIPAVNQIEFNPWHQNTELVQYCMDKGIVVQGYCPLAKGNKMEDRVVRDVAERLGVSASQVLIRWSVQKGVVPLPKSSNEGRMRTNLDIFGFEIGDEDMKRLDGLNQLK